MVEEEKFTLAEAEKRIAAAECERLGCSPSVVMTIRGFDDLIKFRAYACRRCGAEFARKV